MNFARNLHTDTGIIEGDDVAEALVDFAHRNEVTQMYLAQPPESKWVAPLLSRNLVQKVVRLAKDVQIVIVSRRDDPERV